MSFTEMKGKREKAIKLQKSNELKTSSGDNSGRASKIHSRWPKEDEFRWLINRYFDQKNPETHQHCVPEAEAIKAWLKREKYGRSWKETAKNVYKVRRAEDIPAMISRAFRAHKKVERYLSDGKTHLTGHQARLKRELHEWKEKNFVPDYWDDRD